MRASWRRGGGGGGCHAGGQAEGDGVGERGGTRRRGCRSARRLFSLRFLLVWVGRSAGGLGRKGRGWGDGLLELLRLQPVDRSRRRGPAAGAVPAAGALAQLAAWSRDLFAFIVLRILSPFLRVLFNWFLICS
ncbi:hypothetical protein DAI22_05g255000 [Oryza sativa Japonica Group]|nr:hypothetical protein DAI22_05g255000 [Oryza sativa Japonica Group]